MSLHVTLELPLIVEERLRREGVDLAADVTCAYVLELFRRGQLNHVELSNILGLDRHETDALLNRHQVLEGSLTQEDLEADRRTLERVMGQGG